MASHPPELLAPAGSYTAACAALQYGADAIYLGLPRFSARAEAANLSRAELARIVVHAHALKPRRAVYVTLNTLLRDDELPAALAVLETVEESGADGLIVQDLAICRLARRHFPRLRLHASTQMAVHNLEGAQAVAQLGCARVVLARELTLAEINAITASAPLEVEVFVHGALCYSYSGLCLFSALQRGRSGNRGRCAYCCREAFTSDGATDTAYPFSMRDLALLERLDALSAAGVASLKIEGRMKSPLYVAAVTDLYRRKLDGKLDAAAEREAVADVQTIFSRSWTELHIGGAQPPGEVIDANTVGHRGCPIGAVKAVTRDRQGTRWLRFRSERALEKHDGIQLELPAGGRPYGFAVTALRRAGATRSEIALPAGCSVEVPLPPDAPRIPVAAPLFCSASQAVQRRYAIELPRPSECRPSWPLKIEVDLRAEGVALCATPVAWPQCAVALEEAMALDAARQPGQTGTALRRCFERLGGSQWRLAALEVRDAAGRYAPAALLNRLRRELLERLDAAVAVELAARHAARLRELPATAPAAPTPADGLRRSLKVAVATPPQAFAGADEVVLALGVAECRAWPRLEERLAQWRAVLPGSALRLALPLIVRGTDEAAAVEQAAARLLSAGWEAWECGDLAGLHLLSRLASSRLSLTSDATLYALNRVACEQLAELGVERFVAPAEAELETLVALAGVRRPLPIVSLHGYPPLFISDTRPLTPWNSSCDEDVLRLRGRRGKRYETRREDGRWITRARAPRSLPAQLPALLAAGVPEARVDLTGVPRSPARGGEVRLRREWLAAARCGGRPVSRPVR